MGKLIRVMIVSGFLLTTPTSMVANDERGLACFEGQTDCPEAALIKHANDEKYPDKLCTACQDVRNCLIEENSESQAAWDEKCDP